MEETASTNPRLGAVIQRLAILEPDASGRVLEEFSKRLLGRASADFYDDRTDPSIADDVDVLYGLLRDTGAGGIAARVWRVPGRVRHARVATVMPDCPFIVDTLRELLHSEGLHIDHLFHPVLVVDRDAAGHVGAVRDRSAEGPRTSVVLIGIQGQLDDESLAALQGEIEHRLRLVHMATRDFQPMLGRLETIAEDLGRDAQLLPERAPELAEIVELVNWLRDGNFVLLGYRGYEVRADDEGRRTVRVERESSLGILSGEQGSKYFEETAVEDLPPELRARVLGGPLLIVSKTNALSPVHRRARMDDVSIKKLGPEGEMMGERRFLGLFTAKAFAQDASAIPILRRKLREILEVEEADQGSHDYALILRTFNSLPKEELFLAPVDELTRTIEDVMEAETSGDALVFSRPDPLARGVHVMVIIPRERFSGDVRLQIQDALVQAYEGSVLNYHLALGEGDQARLHFYVASELDRVDAVDVKALQDRVRASVRRWDERLTDALRREHPEEQAMELAREYAGRFSADYKALMAFETVVEDIQNLRRLESGGRLQVVLDDHAPTRPGGWLLKVFAPQGRLVLSDVMPILENLGLRVIEAEAYEVGDARSGPASTIHTFSVEAPEAWSVDRRDAEPRVAEALRAIHERRAENVRLNSLILSAGLTWREVALLKAYAGYAFRIGAVASRQGVRRPLVEHPSAARLLHEIFAAQLDPAAGDDRDTRVAGLVRDFHAALEGVRSIEDDRTYRRLLNLVRATVRTNFFQPRASEYPTGMIALKFDCERIEVMPRPRPKYEIYVSSAATEAAHLRMDDVARGGIRWSDRSEDFRVEVLGLVKTQQVKNAVIVPAGAKGAFVVTDPPADPAGRKAAGVASYEEFVRGMLDLTDDVRGGRVVPPEATVIRDGEDPYLVVAADKGTAKLSDTANALAAEYGFWLGDAFASGGSNGYDHKALGITARGAWECVLRHFREMGRNIIEEEFTVVGVGDMSGDVFGNGMLLSRKIRLVAAFDHRHIFLDPNPEPERSWEERRRLFELPGSTWADYDRGLISEGGGVFERGAKKIELSTHARARLDFDEEVVNGDALIRAILRAPVDLLWNGGVGTYVKGSRQTQGEVGDPMNDAVRIDASELRTRIVAEGGNLGLTQPARVEYALGGGRINADALDNSAGVDMSDHEVNLKILLNEAVASGRLSAERRSGLLADVSTAVTDAVLANNYCQSLAVTLDEHRVRREPAEFRDAILTLERAGLLDRQLEELPTAEEMIERQEERGQFLTRPELTLMLAYAKMHLKQRIRTSDLPGDPGLFDLLRDAFPAAAVDAVSEDVLGRHRLRDRITSTALTNLLVDLMGGTGHLRLIRETGRDAADVARAWYVAYRVGEVADLRGRLRRLDDRVPAAVLVQATLAVADTMGRATRWLLANASPEASVAELVERYAKPMERLRAAYPDLLSAGRSAAIDSHLALHEADGIDEETALGLTSFQALDELLPIAQLAHRSGKDAVLVGNVYGGLADAIDFPWLAEQLERAPASDLWTQRAAKTLELELEAARTRMAMAVVAGVRSRKEVGKALAAFRERFADELDEIGGMLADLHALDAANLGALVVAVHAIAERFVDDA
ncbi:MAG: NAD-glutamate dehydrogenase [Gemmatimonadota bacterium]